MRAPCGMGGVINVVESILNLASAFHDHFVPQIPLLHFPLPHFQRPLSFLGVSTGFSSSLLFILHDSCDTNPDPY